MNEEYQKYKELRRMEKKERRRLRKEWGPLGGIDTESRTQTRRIHKGVFVDTYRISYFGSKSHSYERCPSTLTYALSGIVFISLIILAFLSF